MKPWILALALPLVGCVSKARYQKEIGELSGIAEFQAATIKRQAAACENEMRFLLQERDAGVREVERLQGLLHTQLVNNEEILKAAGEGKIKRAKKIREDVLKRNKAALEGKGGE